MPPRRRTLLVSLALSLLPLPADAGTRSFTISNLCSFAVWPAVTNWVQPATNEGYKGLRGWEAPPGNETTIRGSCITGDVPGGLEPDDLTIGNVNVGEWNLDAWGGNDFWDISAVPGWTVPMSIEPDGCDSLSCTEDVLSKCPDERMKQKDSDGNVIGCLSACMAGINAVEPSINCCSGKYNDKALCLPADVDFYSVLKPLCEHAYWYPCDYQPESPTVDFACPSANNPGYKVTFCPGGSGSSSSGDGGGGGSQSASSSPQKEAAATRLLAEATANSVDAAETGAEKDGLSTSTAAATKTDGSSGSSSPTASSKPLLSSPGQGTAVHSAATGSSSTSASSSDGETLLGVSQPVALGVACVAAVLVLLGLGLAYFRHAGRSRATAASREKSLGKASGGTSEEDEPLQGRRRRGSARSGGRARRTRTATTPLLGSMADA